MSHPTRPPHMMRVRDACASLGISVATFYRQAGRPGTPLALVKAGGRTLVSTASMEAWAAALPPASIRPKPTA